MSVLVERRRKSYQQMLDVLFYVMLQHLLLPRSFMESNLKILHNFYSQSNFKRRTAHSNLFHGYILNVEAVGKNILDIYFGFLYFIFETVSQ